MNDLFVHKILSTLPKNAGTRNKKTTRLIIDDYLTENPEVKEEIQAQELLRLLTKKLGQALTQAQETTFQKKIKTDGIDTAEDKLLSLSSADLLAWISPKKASKKPTPAKKTKK